MPQETQTQYVFNRGIMSRRASARGDLERLAVSAKIQRNIISRVLGSMMLRPGLQYLNATLGNQYAVSIPFIFSASDLAEIELTNYVMRVLVSDTPISRGAVTAAVTNGSFTSDVASWTDSDEAGATSSWLTGGYLSLVGTGSNAAIRDQAVTVVEPGVEHALRIIITRGPVMLRVGSSSGGDEYVSETTLDQGTHSLAFTPSAGSFYIRFQNRRKTIALVDSVAVEASGEMQLPAPWALANLTDVRYAQSGDVIYVACDGLPRYKIERRATRSWSIASYIPEDGPFRVINTTAITVTPSAISGNITVAATKPIFKAGHVGSLFRIESNGQTVISTVTGADQWSNPIRVSGIDNQRRFQVTLTGTWVGTVSLQYSVGAPGAWVEAKTWTSNVTNQTYDDTLDNEIIYYRIGVAAGNYTSGTPVVQLVYGSGSLTGIVKFTGFTSESQMSAEVLEDLGGTAASVSWYESRWSDYRGWPSAVVLHEGRLWWMGKDKIDGSVSDAYDSFDDTVVGDSGPILRSIGEGPVDKILWAVSLGRLIIGTALNSADVPGARLEADSVLAARSSSFDEPLTPSNFNLKFASTRVLFVDPSQQRLMDAGYAVDTTDYKVQDLSILAPELNAAGIVQVIIQRKPDTRVHCIRADGTVGMLIFDRAENVTCWLELETEGYVERGMVLPRAGEDSVYYIVRRTIGNTTVRYREKWAQETEVGKLQVNRQADSFIVGTGAVVLPHLVGKQVVVWGDGQDMSDPDAASRTFEVGAGGAVDLTAESWCAGLYYEGRFQSHRRNFAAQGGSAMNRKKRIERVGLVIQDTHVRGLSVGPDFDTEHMNDIAYDEFPKGPASGSSSAGKILTEGGDALLTQGGDNLMIETSVVEDDSEDYPQVHEFFEDKELDMTEFNSDWDTTQQFCLKMAAPRPCTVLAVSIQMTTNG